MKKVRINRNVVEYYDGAIDELPVGRYSKFNQALMMDANVGSTVEDVTRHYQLIRKFIEAGEKEKALIQLNNSLAAYYMIIENITPKMNSFAVLVTSINGKPREDLTQSGIEETVRMLNETKPTTKFVADLVEDVKKKWKRVLMFISRK